MLTTDELKETLKITSATQDAALTKIRDRAVSELNRLTGRQLSYAVITEYYEGEGCDWLKLKNWPAYLPSAIEIYNKSGDYEWASIFDGNDTLADNAAVITETGDLLLKNGYYFPYGARVKVVYPAGYVYGDAWVTGHNYIAGDYSVYNSRLYKCKENHAAGAAFADDLAAAKWELASEVTAPGALNKAALYLGLRMYYESPEGKDFFMKDTETKSGQNTSEIIKVKDINIDKIVDSFRRVNI